MHKMANFIIYIFLYLKILEILVGNMLFFHAKFGSGTTKRTIILIITGSARIEIEDTFSWRFLHMKDLPPKI